MKGTILLNSNENVRQVEEEEKLRFLKTLLEQMGVPVSDFWDSEVILSIDQKIKLQNTLNAYSIQVIDDQDGNMKIYVEKQLVAEWYKSSYKLKRDINELDIKKQLYIEMEVNCWSMFEDEKD